MNLNQKKFIKQKFDKEDKLIKNLKLESDTNSSKLSIEDYINKMEYINDIINIKIEITVKP